MTFDEWWEEFSSEHDEWRYADSAALRRAAFQAGAASRDAYIERLETGLLQVRKALCGDIHNTDDLLDLIASRDAEIAELEAEIERKMSAAEFVLKERDQLREQVKLLREVVNDALSGMGGGYAIWSPRAQEVLAATESRSTK